MHIGVEFKNDSAAIASCYTKTRIKRNSAVKLNLTSKYAEPFIFQEKIAHVCFQKSAPQLNSIHLNGHTEEFIHGLKR